MEVLPLASTITDNFFYLIVEGEEGWLVDPIDAPVAIEAVRARGLREVRVLITHGHPDHVGGNDEVVAALGAEVWAPARAARFPVRHDRGLVPGDVLSLGDRRWEVIAAPGHTDDHLVYRHEDWVISGDVLFCAGIGHARFGGDMDALYRTIQDVVGTWPGSTRFLPGHDYAARNAAFALAVEPDNAAARALLDATEGRSRAAGPWLTTLEDERTYNPFLRVHLPQVQQAMATRVSEAGVAQGQGVARGTFVALRRWRDQW